MTLPGWLQTSWARFAALGVLAFGALAAWYHLARRDRQAAVVARADATEAAATRTLAGVRAELDGLRAAGETKQTEVEALERVLAGRKEALRAKFTKQGLTAGDIATRFRRLGL